MPGFKGPEVLPLRGNVMKVELDRRSLYALASDTRLEMLKALRANRRTVSQLAEVLGIDKAAVHRHLKKLEEGGFVRRTEDHGFVYYALTWKSRDILNPNDRTKIVILLSSSLVCLLAMVLVIYLAVLSNPSFSGDRQEMASDSSDGGSVAAPPAPAVDLSVLAVSMVLGVGAAVLAAAAVHRWRVPRQRGAGPDDTSTSMARPEEV